MTLLLLAAVLHAPLPAPVLPAAAVAADVVAADADTVAAGAAYAAVVDAAHAGAEGAPVDGVPTYRTIGAAVAAANSTGGMRHVIFIRDGRYREKLSIERAGIELEGESRDGVVLTFDAVAGHPAPGGGTWGTRGSYTLRVAAPRFRLRRMTVENSFDYPSNAALSPDDPARVQHAQAVALLLDAGSDRAVFEDCVIRGYQDTLFADAGRAYFTGCRISGHVDFIFGAGQAVFEDCDIESLDRGSRTNNGYIAAPSTRLSQPYGLLFLRSRLLKESPAMAPGSVALGRPWHPSGAVSVNGSAVFIDCWMDDHVGATGWIAMSSGHAPDAARLFEYGSRGPGAVSSPTRRVLTAAEARYYTVAHALGGWSPADDSPGAGQVWQPDLGDGTYRNPIIFADYSDPDVIRVGDDFYMTASSFHAVPGLPILHSRDLVGWTIIGHAVERFPDAAFDAPLHGGGVWAPSLRYHDGWYWIFWGDPDRGVFRVRSRDPRGPWSEPLLVHEALGWIDPAPLWDDDGSAWLVYAFARSRTGFNSVLHIARMEVDGTRLLDGGVLVFDGRDRHPTIEGPKLYRRNGYYYIFAPAGGVRTGWQTVLRSRSIRGPYEDRVVLAQGGTAINGPHQGGYIELENGDGWFIHFQDRAAYGRITHLQPVAWQDDWPLIGFDPGKGTGEPVQRHVKPRTGGVHAPAVPQTSDEFDGPRLGLQWQWQGNPDTAWHSFDAAPGRLRLYARRMPAGASNLWPVPSLLLQKLPAPDFQATTRVHTAGLEPGSRAGLVIMGRDHATLVVERTADFGLRLLQQRSIDADAGEPEVVVEAAAAPASTIHLRVSVREGGVCHFSWSADGVRFVPIGEAFKAREGRWVGAKVGMFATAPAANAAGGHADFDFFRIEVIDANTEVWR